MLRFGLVATVAAYCAAQPAAAIPVDATAPGLAFRKLQTTTAPLLSLTHGGSSFCTTSSPCPVCTGDCDNDAQCQTGLACHHRNSGDAAPPGCAAGGTGDVSGHDYCTPIIPPPVACTGGDTVTAPITIDHPASGTYGNNERCFWRVQCPTGRPRLSFSSFQTERNFDFVYVYEYASENQISELTNRLSGSRDQISDPTFQGGQSDMLLRWYTDGSVTRNGFSAVITCDAVQAADTAIRSFYAPLSPCNDRPLFGAYAGQSCSNFVGGQLTALSTDFREDTQNRCVEPEFRASCCFCGYLQEQNSCDVAQDLSGITSPHSDTLVGAGDSYSLSCAGTNDGPERVFSAQVPAGYRLNIGMSANDYDSRHELRYGGSCPGTTLVDCIDDPDNAEIGWSNTGTTEETAYFMVGAYSAPFGSFDLTWDLASLRAEVITVTGSDGSTAGVNIEVHIRTTTWANEISWNVDGRSDLTFGPYSDGQGALLISHFIDVCIHVTLSQSSNLHDGCADYFVPMMLPSGPHELNLLDSYGDGWHGGIFELTNTDTATLLLGGDSAAGHVNGYGRSEAFSLGSLAAEVTAVAFSLQDVLQEQCLQASNLDAVSPVTNVTLDTSGNYTSCGGDGLGAIVFVTVPSGATITFTPVATVAIHELRWGGACPGENVVTCSAPGDLTAHTWSNNGTSAQTAHFIIHIDGTSANSAEFGWDLTLSPAPPTSQWTLVDESVCFGGGSPGTFSLAAPSTGLKLVHTGGAFACGTAAPAKSGWWGCSGPQGEMSTVVTFNSGETTSEGPNSVIVPPAAARNGLSCAHILQNDPASGSGVYQLSPPGMTPFDVYCDMSIVDASGFGGGWTLVSTRDSGHATLERSIAEGSMVPDARRRAVVAEQWAYLRSVSSQALLRFRGSVLNAQLNGATPAWLSGFVYSDELYGFVPLDTLDNLRCTSLGESSLTNPVLAYDRVSGCDATYSSVSSVVGPLVAYTTLSRPETALPGAFTVQMRVIVGATVAQSGLLLVGDDPVSQAGDLYLSISAAGFWTFGQQDTVGAVSGTTPVTANTAYNLTYTFDGTSAYIYANGVLEVSAAYTSTLSPLFTTITVGAGSHENCVDNFFLPETAADCSAAATSLGQQLGATGYPFEGDYATKGCYMFLSGSYVGRAFFGTGGTSAEMTASDLVGPESRLICFSDAGAVTCDAVTRPGCVSTTRELFTFGSISDVSISESRTAEFGGIGGGDAENTLVTSGLTGNQFQLFDTLFALNTLDGSTQSHTVSDASLLFEYLDIYVRGEAVQGEYFGFDANTATAQELLFGDGSTDQIIPAGVYNTWFAPDFFAAASLPGTEPLAIGTACVDVYKRDANLVDKSVAHYSFDTSIVLDSSGHARHGLVVGSAVTLISDGISGQAAHFDGSNRIDANPFREMQWGASISVSFWFRRTGGAGVANLLFAGNCWSIRMPSTSLVEAGINTHASPGMNELQQSATMYSWQHVGFIYNGNRGSTKLFINGVVTASSNDHGSTGSCVDPTAPLVIGSGYPTGATGPGLIGDMDEIRLYMSVLSDEDIRMLHSTPAGSAAVGRASGLTCGHIRAEDPTAVSGVFRLTPPGLDAFEVYCDMTTIDSYNRVGGWTLVSTRDSGVPTQELLSGSLDPIARRQAVPAVQWEYLLSMSYQILFHMHGSREVENSGITGGGYDDLSLVVNMNSMTASNGGPCATVSLTDTALFAAGYGTSTTPGNYTSIMGNVTAAEQNRVQVVRGAAADNALFWSSTDSGFDSTTFNPVALSGTFQVTEFP